MFLHWNYFGISAEKAVPPHLVWASIKSVLVAGVVGSFFHEYLKKPLGFKKTVCAVGLSSLLFLRVLEDIFQ